MKALSEMDRVKQVEAIQGYNTMKSNLMDYLKKFAENGKVICVAEFDRVFLTTGGTGLKSPLALMKKYTHLWNGLDTTFLFCPWQNFNPVPLSVYCE